MAGDKRHCAFDDVEVRLTSDPKRTVGKGEQHASYYIHVKDSQDGVANCGRQFLTESQTYTLGDRANSELPEA